MKSSEIRKKFLDYFSKKGHSTVASSSLIPEADPTLLFTNAGMVQFKRVFLGEEERGYLRAASCQRCLRAGGKHNDLENVGQTARHLTFFEMLGNFSFGDYFKAEAIEYAWEFLTSEMGLPSEKLYATVFEDDDEAERLWIDKVGLPKDRVLRLGAEDNFWSMGDIGPCGPCSEILIDQGEALGCGKKTCAPGCDCDRYLELWNLVFMQFDRGPDGTLTPLPRPSIDTGMGLERLAAVMQGKTSNYDSDLFTPIISRIEKLSNVKYGTDPDTDISIRAVADHSRAVAFLITDGILPSNEGRGYVLRRIIRRGVRHGKLLGLNSPFLFKVAELVTELMGDIYPETKHSAELITKATRGEEERFFETLERGLALLEDEVSKLKKKNVKTIPGLVAFKLYDTYGFPLDLTADILSRQGFSVDETGFSEAMDSQRKMARESWKGEGAETDEIKSKELYSTLLSEGVSSEFVGYHTEAASSKVTRIIKDGLVVETAVAGERVEVITEQTPFYGESGGQAGDTGLITAKGLSIKVTDTKKPLPELILHNCHVEEGRLRVADTVELVPERKKRLDTARNHTATHLLHSALRERLGEHVRQAGSLVNDSGLRFDFNHFEALTDDELNSIEADANRAVTENIEVVTEVLPYTEAVKKGALAFFGEKYDETVRMVQVKGVSAELCGGTHVARTGDIGLIKIVSEGSVASGVRRLEALTGEAALRKTAASEAALKESGLLLKSTKTEVPEKIRKLLQRQKELEKEISRLKEGKKAGDAGELIEKARSVRGIKVLAEKVESMDPKELRQSADTLKAKMGSGIVVLLSTQNEKVQILASVTKDLTERFSAGEIVKRLAPTVGGKGGGRADMAQAGGKLTNKVDLALEEAFATIEDMASD